MAAADEQENDAPEPASAQQAPPRKYGCFVRGIVLVSIVAAIAHVAAILTCAVFMATPWGMAVAVLFALPVLFGAVQFCSGRPSTKPLTVLIVSWPAAAVLTALLCFEAVFLWLTLLVVALIGYLAFRKAKRVRRRTEPLPTLSKLLTLPVMGLGLLIGVGIGLLLYLDERPGEFPCLRVARPVVPDEENAFLVLQDMMDRFPIDAESWRFSDTWSKLTRHTEEGSPEWQQMARALVKEWEDCLAGMDELLLRPRLVMPWPERSALSWQLLTPESVSYCWWLARFMDLRSKLKLYEGDHEGALDDARRNVRFGRLLARDAESVMTYLAGRAAVTYGLQQTRQVAGSAQVDGRALLAQVESEAIAEDSTNGLINALSVTFARCTVALDEARRGRLFTEEGNLEPGPWPSELVKYPLLMVVKANMSANLLGAYFETIAVRLGRCRAPVNHREGDGLTYVVRALNDILPTRNAIGESVLGSSLPRHALSEHFRLVANARVTQVLLALRCYHEEHGRLPGTLEELAPQYFDAVPVDPFTEQPFGYRPHGEPPRIWSVGPDQQRDWRYARDRDDLLVELGFAAL